MHSKEEHEKALARIVNDDYYFENDPYGEDKASAFDKDVDMIEQLIEEHFKPKENTSEFKTLKNLTKIELIDYIKMLYHNWGVCDDQLKRVIDKAKELSNSNDELERTIHSLDCELSDVYNHKPYKLEDLKPNMWVYDIKYDEFCRIDFIAGIYPHRSYSDGTCEDGAFEENRFFPVQYANLIKMGVKDDGTQKSTDD